MWWKRVLMAALATAFALLLGEAALRIADVHPGPYPPSLYERDEDCVYRLSPGFRMQARGYTVQISEQGFRDRFYGEKPPGVTRILVLGDSYVFGQGCALDETFTKVMERMGKGLEVINAGVGGYGTLNELRLFRKYGLALKPDIVILCFYEGNDLVDNLVFSLIRPRDERAGPLEERLFSHLRVYELLRCSLRIVRMKMNWLLGPEEQPLPGVTVPGGLDPTRENPMAQFVRRTGPKLDRAWTLTVNAIAELHEVAKENRAKLVVVSVPANFQVTTADWREALPGGATYAEYYAPDVVTLRLGLTCADMGIPFLSLLRPFQQAAAKQRLYLRPDGHLNPAGHRLAAELILTELRRWELVP